MSFDPRPREGGDTSCDALDRQFGFDPRPREGGDADELARSHGAHEVSIHAPVKGATAWLAVERGLSLKFRSTPP